MPSEGARLDGSERKPQAIRGLGVGEAGDVEEPQDLALLRRDPRQLTSEPAANLVEPDSMQTVRRGCRDRALDPRRLLVGPLPRAPAPVAIDRPRPRHHRQPGEHRRAPVVVPAGLPPGLEKDLLQDVLGLGAVASIDTI